MKKILGYIAVLFVFSWVTTANAGPIAASITNSNGDLTIDGFSPSFGDGDASTINFLFDFTPGQSDTVSVFQPITVGQSYNVALGFDITGLGPFNANFNIVSQNSIPAFSGPVDTILGGLYGSAFSGTPLGLLTVNGDMLDLLKVVVGGSVGDPTLELFTKVTSGTSLINFLNSLDGSVTAGFTNANLTVTVPEPTALLLFGSGLLVMIGFSKKRV